MCLNPINAEFDLAYVNVGLLASDVWSFYKKVTEFKKANLNLWIRFNEIEQRLVEDESEDGNNSSSNEKVTQTVRDTIPSSRLASYNDFVYNEEREKLYCNDEDYSNHEDNSFPIHNGHNDLEIWMLPEVEEEFKRLTCMPSSNWSCVSPRLRSGRELTSFHHITSTSPYDWLTQTAWPGQLVSRYPELPRAIQYSNRKSFFKDEELALLNYSSEELEEKLEVFPCPRYLIESNDELELHMKIDSPAVRQIWAKEQFPYGGFSPCIGLNAEVPEFQPVTVRLQQYPSIYNTTYEQELFPYSNQAKFRIHQQHMDINSPNMFSQEEVQNIPVFVRPPESYINIETSKHRWRKSHRNGAVVSNLITLTGTGKPETIDIQQQSEQDHTPSCHSTVCYNVGTTKPMNTQQMLFFLDKWLRKIYNPRSTDFSSMSTISGRIDEIFQNVQQNYCSPQEVPSTMVNRQPKTHRPLYSDVLMNEVSVGTGVKSCSDCKYDELEREALEQYSGSDTALMHQVGQPGIKIRPRDTPSYWSPTRDSKLPLSTVNFSPRLNPSPRSPRSCGSPSDEARRKNSLDGLNPYNFTKQALWAKRRKKKSDKKINSSKHKKRALSEPQHKIIENKKLTINKFINMKTLFTKTFFDGNWTLVQSFITVEIEQLFYSCLKMLKQCSSWFKTSILSTDFKEDLKNNKRNLEFSIKVMDTAYKLINILYQYIKKFSHLKMIIPCDQRLYGNPAEVNYVRPLLSFLQDKPNFFAMAETLNIDKWLPLEINGENVQSLYKFLPQHLVLVTNKEEWMLSNFDTLMNRKCFISDQSINSYSPLLLNFTHNSFCLTVKNRFTTSTNKLVKIVEDSSIWSSWQWTFINGWKFDISSFHGSLHWLDKFNANLLDNLVVSANMFLAFDCAFRIINDLFFNNLDLEFVPIWDSNTCNLVSRKIVFMEVLLKQEDGCYFRIVRINKKSCLPMIFSCANTCCISWMLGPPLGQSLLQLENTFGKNEGSECLGAKKVKPLVNQSFSQSKNQIFNTISHAKEAIILDKISNIEMIYPPEKTSICSLC